MNRFSWTEIELNTYEQEEKRERDAQAILEQKLMEAEARGKAEGKAEGEAIGEARGKAEGIDNTLQAIDLLKSGYTIDEISQQTGIAREVVEKLQQSLIK